MKPEIKTYKFLDRYWITSHTGLAIILVSIILGCVSFLFLDVVLNTIYRW